MVRSEYPLIVDTTGCASVDRKGGVDGGEEWVSINRRFNLYVKVELLIS